MKKLLSLLLILLSFGVFAQNTHKFGQQIVEDQKTDSLYNSIKEANIYISNKISKADEAVHYVDNSKSKYFPPIISQVGGSCAYASGVGYIYNYEFNALYDLDSSKPENIYNYLQVYAFLNGGEDHGGHAQKGWQFIAQNGVPNIKEAKTKTIFEWHSGYKSYLNGMDKGTASISKFNSGNPGEIEKMKQYLLDKGNGYGGLIQFSAYADPFDPTLYTGPHSEGSDYDAIIPKFGVKGMHSMTIVGFDDEIEWDYDGEIKKGAFICANTWGEDWGHYSSGCKTNKGRFYAPYYAFTTLRQGNGGTGNGGKDCLIVTVKKIKADLVMKISLEHSSRNDIELEIGIANSKNATKPTKTISKKFMSHAGGDKPMTAGYGNDSKTLEFALNISELEQFITGTEVTYFLKVINDPKLKKGEGKLLSCSLLDYRDDINKPKVLFADIVKSELKDNNIAIAYISRTLLKLNNDELVNLNCSIDKHNKEMIIDFISLKDTPIKIDLFKKGKFKKSLVDKVLVKGISSEDIKFDSSIEGSYELRIIVANKYIYKYIRF